MSDLKWINYRQNNIGGYIIQNKEVSELVFIQGEGLEQIKSKADSLFADYCEYCECCGESWRMWVDESDLEDEPTCYGEYCECCGERWRMWVDESDLEDEPTCYGESIKDKLSLFSKKGYATLHYHKGDVRYVNQHDGDYLELGECPDED